MATEYPWKLTKREKALFEQLCIGNDDNIHIPTVKNLIKKGLVNQGNKRFVEMKNPIDAIVYTIPLHIHMEWCDWCYINFDDEGNEL